MVDEEGFQLVTSRRASLIPDPSIDATTLNTSNGFDCLVDHPSEIDNGVQETALGAISHPPDV